MDAKRVAAYVGHSFSAAIGAKLTALEQRIGSFVLMAGGFSNREYVFDEHNAAMIACARYCPFRGAVLARNGVLAVRTPERVARRDYADSVNPNGFRSTTLVTNCMLRLAGTAQNGFILTAGGPPRRKMIFHGLRPDHGGVHTAHALESERSPANSVWQIVESRHRSAVLSVRLPLGLSTLDCGALEWCRKCARGDLLDEDLRTMQHLP